jgi:GntR family transcriptional repressor for pyruvate dehydrogenase complex
VVREALKSLSARGLVEVKRGSGTYVRELKADMMSRPLGLLLQSGRLRSQDIHEVRDFLEVHLAGLAAERARTTDLDAMQATIDRFRNDNPSPTEYAETDLAFHILLAEAAGNPLFTVLANSVNHVMVELRLGSYRELGPEETFRRTVYFHSMILDRVRQRDADGARKAMREHLDDSLQILLSLAAKTVKQANPVELLDTIER